MASSSTRSIYGSRSSSIHPENTTTNPQIIVTPHVVDKPTYNLDRFLDRVGQIPINQQQRPPPGLVQTKEGAVTEAEAETKAKERMSTQLQEFDVKFGYSNMLSRS